MAYKIAILPGDGTGPEVVAEGLKTLEAVAGKVGFQYETETFDFGGERYKRTGETLPAGALDDRHQCAEIIGFQVRLGDEIDEATGHQPIGVAVAAIKCVLDRPRQPCESMYVFA